MTGIDVQPLSSMKRISSLATAKCGRLAVTAGKFAVPYMGQQNLETISVLEFNNLKWNPYLMFILSH